MTYEKIFRTQINSDIIYNSQIISIIIIIIYFTNHICLCVGVVEFQAAGVITLAHDSGGPRMDIVDVSVHKKLRFPYSDD